MYPAQTTSSTPCSSSQSAIALVARLAIGVVREREDSSRHTRRLGPRQRSRVGVLDATATTGNPASSSACRFVPSPLTRTPITRARSSR